MPEEGKREREKGAGGETDRQSLSGFLKLFPPVLFGVLGIVPKDLAHAR